MAAPAPSLLSQESWHTGPPFCLSGTSLPPPPPPHAPRPTRRSVRLSPDNTHVLSCGADARIVLWQWREQDPVRVYSGHYTGVTCCDMSPTGNRIVSGDGQGMIMWVRCASAEAGRPPDQGVAGPYKLPCAVRLVGWGCRPYAPTSYWPWPSSPHLLRYSYALTTLHALAPALSGAQRGGQGHGRHRAGAAAGAPRQRAVAVSQRRWLHAGICGRRPQGSHGRIRRKAAAAAAAVIAEGKGRGAHTAQRR